MPSEPGDAHEEKSRPSSMHLQMPPGIRKPTEETEARPPLKVLDVFDAARRGTLEEFEAFYGCDPAPVNKYTGMSLLCACAAGFDNLSDKLLIAARLVADGADLSFADRKYGRTALHWLFFPSFLRSSRYLYDMAALLIDAGADVNANDKYSAIPLKYAVANTKGDTEALAQVYRLLLEAGSDCRHADAFGKTCLDYAREYCWRTGFIDIAAEVEDGKR